MKRPLKIEVSALNAAGLVVGSTPLFDVGADMAAIRSGVMFDDLTAEYSYQICADQFPSMKPSPPPAPPNAPSDIEVRAFDGSHCEVLWVDRDSGPAVSFEIEKDEAIVATVPEATDNVWLDPNGKPGDVYRVRATRDGMPSSWSEPATAVVTAPPPPPPPDEVTLTDLDLSKCHQGGKYYAPGALGVYSFVAGSCESKITIRGDGVGKTIIRGGVVPKGATDVTFTDVTLNQGGKDTQDNSYAGWMIGTRWTIKRFEVMGCVGVGMSLSKAQGVTLEDGDIHDNGRAGLGGSSASNFALRRLVVHDNNTAKKDGNGGGGKFTRSHDATADDCVWHDNTGPGNWLDYNNYGWVFTNCTFKHNADGNRGGKLVGGPGQQTEISGMEDKAGGASGWIDFVNCTFSDNCYNRAEIGLTKDRPEGCNHYGSCKTRFKNCRFVGHDVLCIRDNRAERAASAGGNSVDALTTFEVGRPGGIFFDPNQKGNPSFWTIAPAASA